MARRVRGGAAGAARGRPLVGIVMGSSSDAAVMRGAAEALDGLGVPHEDRVVSAHRTPGRLSEYAAAAEAAGIGAIVAGAGGAAHLPGMLASFTVLPVVGVPIMRGGGGGPPPAFGGLDALLSISEMPTGSPVACVGVNKAANAGLYAAMMLAGSVPGLRERLLERKAAQAAAVSAESERMRRSGLAGFRAGRAAAGPAGRRARGPPAAGANYL